jgi:hypothetical protein
MQPQQLDHQPDPRYWQPVPAPKPEVSTGQAWVNSALLVMAVLNLLLTLYIFRVVFGLVEAANSVAGFFG